MENEFQNTMLQGFSSRATNPDFLEEIIEVRKKDGEAVYTSLPWRKTVKHSQNGNTRL